MNGDNGWEEYKRVVLHRLECIENKQSEFSLKIHEVRMDIKSLRVKSGVWGAIAGLIPVAVALVWFLMK
jgi:hypothetical protein